jgi:hypothetical protein
MGQILRVGPLGPLKFDLLVSHPNLTVWGYFLPGRPALNLHTPIRPSV